MLYSSTDVFFTLGNTGQKTN